MVFQLVNQKLAGLSPDLISRLRHRSDGGNGHRGNVDVVKTDNGKISWDGKAQADAGVDGCGGKHVGDAEKGVGPVMIGKNLRRCRQAEVIVDLGQMGDPFLVDGDVVILQAFAECRFAMFGIVVA